MTRFLLDTSFLIDVIRKRAARAQMLRELVTAQHEMACCPVNVTEIYAGMRDHEATGTESLLSSLEWIPVSFTAAQLAGNLLRRYRQEGKTFSVPDMIIAGVCITEDLTLITDNRKDFTMPELKLHPLK